MKNSAKKFLKRPEFPGGKVAFKEYVKKNLAYPAKALENEVEGIVHLSARIDDNGHVDDIVIEKGLGYGCDEEAIRLIKNIQYGSVKNKGVRLKTRQRFRIEFRLPARNNNVKYHYKKSADVQQKGNDKATGKTYSYSINANK